MADVVGTAFVRIKALTNQLAKDIEKSVKKGMKDANLEKAAKERGGEVGESFGDGFADASSKSIKKRSKDFLPGDDVFEDVQKKFRNLDIEFDDPFQILQDNFDAANFDLPEIDFDIEPAKKSFKAIRDDHKNTADDIDNGALSRALDRLAAKFRSLGNDSGLPSIGRLGKAIGLLGAGIIGALPYLQDVGSAVLAYATGLVAQIGFLGTALGGLGVAAAAAIGGAVTAALPIFLAFKAETEELAAFKDSVAAFGEEFMRVGVATQQTLLPALDEALFILGDLVPIFSEFGLFVGRAAGNYARLASGVLVGEVAQGRFQDILQSSLRILDLLLPTLLHFGDILSGLWVAAIPAAERFAGTLHNLVGGWADMVNVGLKTGELTDTFNTWYERAEVLGGALGNLAGALWDIFSVGADSSDSVFRRFDDWAERYRAWTESEVGQNKLATIFDNALAVMHEVNGIAKDLFDGILGRIGDVGGVDSMVDALQRFRDIIPEIQEAWANAYTEIKRVTELFGDNIWTKIKTAWEQLREPLGRLGEQIKQLFETMNESGAFDVFLDLMEILTNVLSTLLAIPGFGTFIAYFIAFGGAIKVAHIALNPFVRIFGGFLGLMVKLAQAKVATTMATTATGLQGLAAGFRAAQAANAAGVGAGMAAAAAQASGGAASMSASVGGAVAGLGAFGPALAVAGAALVVGGGLLYANQQKWQKWRQEVRQATDALGLVNGGLNVTAEGVAKYVEEFSRFETNDQLDDISRMGLSIEELGTRFVNGTLDAEKFLDTALRTNEIDFDIDLTGVTDGVARQANSLEGLRDAYRLTDEQVQRLIEDQETWATDGTRITLTGNTSIMESYLELSKVIGQAAKDNIDAFTANEQNLRLLGGDALADIKSRIDDASADQAGRIMIDVQEDLSAAAQYSANSIKGLSDATRDQIRAQATLNDGTVDWIREEQLLRDALKKQNTQIRANIDLFRSANFAEQFGPARDAVIDFNTLMANTDMSGFDPEGNLDLMLAKFPQVATATDNLFQQLQQLPVEEFNAAATALGVDADVLREAMNGAQQAIIDLQEQALATLPSIGELLDDSTSVNDEGEQIFDKEGFVSAINERVTTTQDFAKNIKTIKERIGEDAARLAAQEGPEAAKNLVTMIGHDEAGLEKAIDAMELSEEALKIQISEVLGPGIAWEYGQQAGIISKTWGQGIAGGLNSPSTLQALQGSSLDALDFLARGFRGHFEISPDGVLSFKHTGTFAQTSRSRRIIPGGTGLQLAGGGLVDLSGVGGMFKASGTDIVPAMLTPGEFVNTASTVDRLGVKFFEDLNRGATPVAPIGGGQINASGWTIVAPTPEESARQMVARFRSLSFLSGGR